MTLPVPERGALLTVASSLGILFLKLKNRFGIVRDRKYMSLLVRQCVQSLTGKKYGLFNWAYLRASKILLGQTEMIETVQ